MVFATVTSAKVLDNKAGNVQKRRVGRVDAYEHLVPENGVVDAERIESLRCVAAAEAAIKSAELLIFRESRTTRWREYFRGNTINIIDCLTEEWRHLSIAPGSCRIGDLRKAARLRYFREYVDNWDIERLESSMCADMGEMLTEVLQLQVRMTRMARLAAIEITKDVYAAIPRWYDEHGNKTRGEYLVFLAVSRDAHAAALADLLCLFGDFRDAIRYAARAPHLTNAHLVSLQAKLEGVEEQFDEAFEVCNACEAAKLEREERRLIYLDSEKWWNPPTEPSQDNNMPPASAAIAYPKPSTMHSSLLVIVPAVSLLSVIPAAFAWTHGSNHPGITADPDFYQAVAGAMMQLLGLLTFIWPTLSHPRLCAMAWIWIWVLAAFSAMCAILSIPLFLAVSNKWSFGVAFAGVLAQAIVQLQVINSI